MKRTPITLFIISALAFSFSSCSIFKKTKFQEKKVIDSSSVSIKSHVEGSKKKDSSSVTVDEIGLFLQEDQYNKKTIIEDYSPDGKLTKRTTTKEKSDSKKTEQTEKKTTEHKASQTTSQAADKAVEKKQSTTQESTTKVEKSRAKLFTGIALSLLAIILLYLLYRYFRKQIPNNIIYPF